jgi:uncharacterized protein involved in outer membrane biogenesis
MAGGTQKLRDWRPPRWGVVAAVLLALIAGLALAYDDTWIKTLIERRVAAVTGRHFEIGGDFDVSLGRPGLGLDASGVALGNASWSKSPVMARARSVHVDIDPWPLLRGRLDVTRIALDKPELLLERNARGQANWRFDPKRPKRASTTIRALSIRDGTLRVREPALHTDLRLAVETERVTLRTVTLRSSRAVPAVTGMSRLTLTAASTPRCSCFVAAKGIDST